MSSKPSSAEDRIKWFPKLIVLRDQLKLAIDLVDHPARDQIRRDMIICVEYLYSANWVDAVSRFNDIVKGIDEVAPDWE